MYIRLSLSERNSNTDAPQASFIPQRSNTVRAKLSARSGKDFASDVMRRTRAMATRKPCGSEEDEDWGQETREYGERPL